jgi:phosphoglycerate dehydrogenase-like enzyme
MLIALDESYRDASAALFPEQQVVFFDGPSVRRAEIVEVLRDAEILAVRRPFPFFVDREFIQQLRRVQFVHKSGTGVEGFDVAALSDHGILLASNRGVNASCVAEHAVLLTLLCLRNSFQYLTNMRRGIWKQDPPPPGIFQLEGKTVGIVGMGAIGCELAKRMAAFGTKILAYRRRPLLEVAILGGVRWLPLDDLLSESDVVTVNVPLTEKTEGMIGARELALMKPTCVLINTSRGRVIDERALYEALVEGRLLAAGLDVFQQEPTPKDNPLLKLENVFATPHISGRSVETRQGQIAATMQDITSFLAGRRPRYVINPEILEQGTARAGQLR